VDEKAFSPDDITSLQTMADHLAVAVQNAYTLDALQAAHAELLRTKVYEALTVATTEAIHWIGNKAMPISMTITRLQEELAAGQPDLASLQEDLTLIAESAAQIVQVKEQLIGQGREQKPRPVLLEDVLRVAARRRGVENVKLEIAAEAAHVIADSTQLARALGNLLQNAAEAGAKTIAVKAAPAAEKGRVRILISDDGAGMPPDVLEKVWSPFFTTRVGHHGLGLPAARHVITQLEGRIGIESRPGKGTTVEIILPAGHPLLGDLGQTPAVLLFDDDDEWSRFFIKTVKTAKLAAKMDPKAELILVDEDADNFEAILAEIQAASLAGKTVVVTAAIDVDRMTALLHSGFKDVKLKPYSPAEIPALWEK
jgi:signal transduction histidine kinase